MDCKRHGYQEFGFITLVIRRTRILYLKKIKKNKKEEDQGSTILTDNATRIFSPFGLVRIRFVLFPEVNYLRNTLPPPCKGIRESISETASRTVRIEHRKMKRVVGFS